MEPIRPRIGPKRPQNAPKSVSPAESPEGRRNDPRIGLDRHALIMSGAAILQALLRCWPTDRLSVADRGLREGMLYAQMSADGVLSTQEDA